EKIRTLEFYRESNKERMEYLSKQLETFKLEKDGVDVKLAGLLKASKNLDNLIKSQRSNKNKDGVGYSAVPPPVADLYLSPKKDLSWTGLPEFADDTVTDYSRTSPTIESTSEEGQNKNSSTSEDVASHITPKPFVKFVKPKDCQSEIIIMAHQQLVTDVHPDELCPLNRRKELSLPLDDFRIVFHLPQATDNNHDRFVPPLSFYDMIPFYKNHLGFTMELKIPSSFKTIGRYKDKVGMKMPGWMITEAMEQTEHYRMYVEAFGIDVPLIQSQPTEFTQGTHRTLSAPRSPTPKVDASAPTRSTVVRLRLPQQRSTHLTLQAPVLAVDKVDELILQDTLQIEKMVKGQENVADDSSIPRNDGHNIPGTRLEPRSDKESPEVGITDVIVPMNVYDEEEEKDEITDEVRNQVPVYVAKGLILEREKNKEEMEKMITKAILQERGNIQEQISSQTQQEISNDIPSQVDAFLKKIAEEMLRQRCTSGDEHQYHIDQMKNFLKSGIVYESRKEILVSPHPRKTTPLVLSCQRDPEAPTLSLINQDLLYLKKGNSGPEKIVLSLHKFLVVVFNDDDIEERTSRWVNKCVNKFNPSAQYGVEHWKNPHAKIFYIKKLKELGKQKEIIARRANEYIVSITEPDFKNLYKNGIEDMYLLIMNEKVHDYAETGLLWSLSVFIRSLVIWERVHDFQFGIESYQQKINLTTPTISFPKIKKHEMFSIIYEPMHGIIYKNSKKEKRVMRHSEIHKFYDATLNRVLEGLKSYNNDVRYGYNQRHLTKDEVGNVGGVKWKSMSKCTLDADTIMSSLSTVISVATSMKVTNSE
nr:hypothetical protein [Tanacetum cinerariifolium]